MFLFSVLCVLAAYGIFMGILCIISIRKRKKPRADEQDYQESPKIPIQQSIDENPIESVIAEEELNHIKNELNSYREKILAVQRKRQEEEDKEDFLSTHSLGITDEDIEDIEAIKNFSKQLNKRQALNAFIWTEYVQKKIQELCKRLDVNKRSGIYIITNIENNKSYIGQSVDIGTRFKEHCKKGLGVNSLDYLTNKFYQALNEKSIQNFTFQVLEFVDKDLLDERERYWINFYNTVVEYNTKVGG